MISRLRTLLNVAVALALLAAAWTVVSSGGHLRAQTASMGGAFVPTADYTVTGAWTFGAMPSFYGKTTCNVAVNASGVTVCSAQTGTGSFVLGTGPTISAPVLSGTVTGTYTLGGTPTITGLTGTALSSGNFTGVAVQSSASLGGSPVTLTAAQCGQAFALDAATGVVYLMPATFPTVGCSYDFYANTSVTSNAHEIETNNAAHFFNGEVLQVAAAATRIDQCNGSSHIAYKTNGTTTGGLLGLHIRVVVQSTTVAHVEGLNPGSGTLATGCSASN